MLLSWCYLGPWCMYPRAISAFFCHCLDLILTSVMSAASRGCPSVAPESSDLDSTRLLVSLAPGATQSSGSQEQQLASESVWDDISNTWNSDFVGHESRSRSSRSAAIGRPLPRSGSRHRVASKEATTRPTSSQRAAPWRPSGRTANQEPQKV